MKKKVGDFHTARLAKFSPPYSCSFFRIVSSFDIEVENVYKADETALLFLTYNLKGTYIASCSQSARKTRQL
jgi:hypothetical protein